MYKYVTSVMNFTLVKMQGSNATCGSHTAGGKKKKKNKKTTSL